MIDNTAFTKQRGSTLVTGLLIMFFVIVVAAAIMMSLNSRARISRFSTSGIVAQYASESAMELGLMTIAQSRFDRDSFDDTSTALSDIASLTIPFSNTAEIQGVAVQNGSGEFREHLRENEVVTIDLVKPDSAPLSPTLDRITLSWDTIDTFERVEVAWFGLDPSETPSTGRTFLTTADSGGAPVVFNFDDAFGYRVTIKSLESGINNLVVVPKSNTGLPLDFEPMFEFQAVGSFGGSEWTKMFASPWRAPATGLLQYVIFSDEKLSKPVL